MSVPTIWRQASPMYPESTRVSVIMPVRDEAEHLEKTLASVLQQTFPAERTEIIVVDGASTDGTREILQRYAERYSNLRVLDNPRRTAPTSLNLGIAASDGDVVVRVDGHCRLAPDYIERCVQVLADAGAGNVGGLMRARATTPVGEAIALATSSRFGIGNARFHYLERECYVDTVYLGAFRREVLEEVGGYDPELTRNQDDELNYRIREAGYGILLSPDIVSSYTPRESIRALWTQYFQYGYWKIRVIRKHPGSAQARHLAPAALVAGLVCSLIAFLVFRRPWLLAPVLAYVAAVGTVSLVSGARKPRLLPLLLLVFPCLHLGYGTGFLWAVLSTGLTPLRAHGREQSSIAAPAELPGTPSALNGSAEKAAR